MKTIKSKFSLLGRKVSPLVLADTVNSRAPKTVPRFERRNKLDMLSRDALKCAGQSNAKAEVRRLGALLRVRTSVKGELCHPFGGYEASH